MNLGFPRLALAVIPLAAALGCASIGGGRAAAKQDLSGGKYVIMAYGYHMEWIDNYRDSLRQHGIELRFVAGCIVSRGDVRYVQGYNEVMQTELEKRYGADFLQKLRDEAFEKYRRQHQEGT